MAPNSPTAARKKSVSYSDTPEYFPLAPLLGEDDEDGSNEPASESTSTKLRKRRDSSENSHVASNGSLSASPPASPSPASSPSRRSLWTKTRSKIRTRAIASNAIQSMRARKQQEKLDRDAANSHDPSSPSSSRGGSSAAEKIPFAAYMQDFTPEEYSELKMSEQMDARAGSKSPSRQSAPSDILEGFEFENTSSHSASPSVSPAAPPRRAPTPKNAGGVRPNFRRMETAPMEPVNDALLRRRKRTNIQSDTHIIGGRSQSLAAPAPSPKASASASAASWDEGYQALPKASVISIGYRIYGVRNIDNRSETFVVDFRLFANWSDKRLRDQIQSGEVSLRDGEPVDPEQIWVPQFQISQAVEQTIVDTGCTLEDSATGWVRWHQRFRVTMSQYLHLARFPFDAQNLKILIRLPRRSDNRRIFAVRLNEKRVEGPHVINPFHLDEWTVHAPSASLKLVKNKPEFTISVPVRRKHGFYFTNVGLFMFALTSLAFVSLFFPVDSLDARSDTTLALILTAVAFKLVVADNLPQIPYSTWLDKYIMMCFAFLFSISVGNVVISQIDQIAAGYVDESAPIYDAGDHLDGSAIYQCQHDSRPYSETEIARLSNKTFAILMLVIWVGLHIHVYLKVRRWQKVLDAVLPAKVEKAATFEDDIEKMFATEDDPQKKCIKIPSAERVSCLDLPDATRSKASFVSRNTC